MDGALTVLGSRPRRSRLLVAVGTGAASVALPGAVAASPPTVSLPPGAAPADPAITELTGGLIGADQLGLPPDWVIRDADRGVLGDDPEPGVVADLDPFLGLLDCPLGVVTEGVDRTWVTRRFRAPEVPLEDGLLSVEVIVEEESPADAADDVRALADCSVSDQSELTVAASELELGDGELVPATALTLHSAPSAAVPYPSSFATTIVNHDGRTVTVVLGGLDQGESWGSLSDQIAVITLERLDPISFTNATDPGTT